MTDTPMLPVRRHEKHWVPDGSVVIGAVDSKNRTTTLFQVHRTLLTDQSEVFASMFSLPQGEGNCQTDYYDGLPYVLLPDTSEEVVALLNVLRDPFTFLERTPFSDTPIRFRPALKMASKYVMTDLRAKLVRAFESEWPLTVEDLEFKDQLLNDYFAHDEHGVRELTGHFKGWPLHLNPEPASAIALAEEFNIETILPAAYYDIMRCAPRSEWDEDFDWSKTVYIGGPPDKPARWACLSAKSYRKIMRLQDIMTEEIMKHFGGLRNHLPRNCGEREEGPCRTTWMKLVEEGGYVAKHVQNRDLFEQLRSLRTRSSRSFIICDECKTSYLKAIQEHRKDSWEVLEEVSRGGVYYG
ncbi:hypothetical protein SCHPADRAFT_928429 [Schizopora paradoxa]|uniref:BTB domain-containing protein n=1 Tax=Schizopora paradoxa TaxID=27342 RepID=A0A0H2RP06_9AGAM|nr:hypothetical protein SCHPADRAFT_928429 [Schizopora paradoxa]